MSAPFRSELIPMLRLATPVVLAELGWMSMGLVDTVMVAPLGPAAIGATGIGNALHIAFAIFGMGLLLGLDTLVAQAYGAGDSDDCHRWLVHGLLLAAIAALPLTAACLGVQMAIPHVGFHPEVMPLLRDRSYLEGSCPQSVAGSQRNPMSGAAETRRAHQTASPA